MVKTKNCINCGETIKKKRGQKRWKKRKYCSRNCYYDYNDYENHGEDIGTETECKYCGEAFTRNTQKQKYCCTSCSNKHQYKTGQRNSNEITKKANKAIKQQAMEKFKENPNTTVNENGYRYIYIPANHPKLEQGWMLEHRYVWWKNKGELPSSNKVIHHKDHNKKNNNIENLHLMDEEDHGRLHANS